MRIFIQYLVVFVLVWAASVVAQEADPSFTPKLLIAWSAYSPRPKHPTVYFYHHDGAAQGKTIDSIKVEGKRSDYRPSLTHDGRFCAFASEEENETSRIFLWDMAGKQLTELGDINRSKNAQLDTTISGKGDLLAFSAWSHPEGVGRWDVMLYDVRVKKLFSATGLNEQKWDERQPNLSAVGLLACVSNQPGGAGNSDIVFYDVPSGRRVADDKLNSPHLDAEPSLSADARLVAFVSDRPDGEGGRDIYLHDRQDRKLIPLPGLNSGGQEQTPSLSPSGRYIAFVSERISGEGERDIFLYDRTAGKLLPTPKLNGKHEDLDPCVIEVGGK